MIYNNIEEKVYKAFNNINFPERYKAIFKKYNDFENMMTRMNKSQNLNVLKELGYDFKIFSPGQYYNMEEQLDELKLKLSFKINKGFITTYIYVYKVEERINISHNNFAFLYRHLINNMNAETTAPKFKDYEELKSVLRELLLIYEDFKNEFLKTNE